MSKNTLDCVRHRPEVVVAFVKRLIQGYQTQESTSDRRSLPRKELVIPIVVQPLDSDFRSSGTSFRASTKDISTGGLGIFHSEPIYTKYVRIEISTSDGEQMPLLAQVKHCTAQAESYHIGARFVVDWSSYREDGRSR